MLNKQGPKGIKYCQYTWNPVSGYCFHQCPYCYMRPIWKRFRQLNATTFRNAYLRDRFPKKPSVIFVGSSTDLFGDWVHSEWIQEILDVVAEKDHTFLFLTKNPKRYAEFEFPKNAWCGTTMDGREETALNGRVLDSCKKAKTWVSVEPMLAEIDFQELLFTDWVVIGCDSRKGAKKVPQEWIHSLYMDLLTVSMPVFIKENAHYPFVVEDLPKGMK